MAVPAHLQPILQALGTGGTREMAERVHAYIGELQRQLDYASDQIITLTGVLLDEFGGDGPLKHPDLDEAGPCGTAVRVLREQAAEIGRLNTLLDPKRATIREKIEASSLGTPDAVAARAGVPAGLAEAAVRRAAELVEHPDTSEEDTEDDWADDEPAPVEPLHTIDRAEPIATTPASRAPSNEEIRAWCRANGVAVSAKGQISARARAAYDAAHPPVTDQQPPTR
jgi:hypothetical protein